MRSNYKKLGQFIQQVDIRNIENRKENLLGVSTKKIFIESIANTVGTNFKKYKIVKQNQFTYVPDTSRRGNKIGIALLEHIKLGLVSQAYTVFEIIDKKQLLPEYLMMWFRRPEFDRYARYKSHGSVREIFDWEEMCEVELPVPSIEKQQEIVDEYNTITNRIKLNEQFNKKLEETAQAIYKHWFVDFEFPNEDGKPYKSSNGKMVWNEELEKDIPERWEIDKVENYIRYNYANFNIEDEYETIEYLDTSNITNNKIEGLHKLTIGIDKIPSRAKRKVTHNDIVYSTVRPNLKHFGIIKKPNDNMLVSTGFIVIQRKNEYVCIELIYMWLTQKETIDYLQSKAEMSVATYPSIKPEDILNIKTLIPKDKTKLIKFKQLLSPILNTQWKRNEDNKQLEKLRMLLLSIIAKG